MNDKNYYVNFLQNGVRGKTNITFNTSLGVIFGVKKYAERLLKVHCMYSNINYEFLIITFLYHQILDAFNFNCCPIGENLMTVKIITVVIFN